jgi:putative acetyltransferase
MQPLDLMHRPYSLRRAESRDRADLVALWLASVRASHFFLSEAEIEALLPAVREELHGDALELWVLCDWGDEPVAFLGLAGAKLEALWVAPGFQRRGLGRRLVAHAVNLNGELTLDVNEQNVAAQRFYAACGFRVEGRSAHDCAGRPYPLLHMRRP